MDERKISIKGARTHNLKNVSLDIPAGKLVVLSGVSGSGKSSLAFDTLYAEGQRRYVESLSPYARQFLDMAERPDVDSIDGLSPAISIEQKNVSHNPRSTVGTVTEIYDYLRLLFARCGTAVCPDHGTPLSSWSPSQMASAVMGRFPGRKLSIRTILANGRKGEFKDVFETMVTKGFSRFLVDGEEISGDQPPVLDKRKKHDVAVVVDRLSVSEENRLRLAESFETAASLGSDVVVAVDIDSGEEMMFSTKFACPECSWTIGELEPRLFSFNSPVGACKECSGIGEISDFEETRIIPDTSLSIADGAIVGWDRRHPFQFGLLGDLARHFKFSISTPWKDLPEHLRHGIMRGFGEEAVLFRTISSFSGRPLGKRKFEGVVELLSRKLASAPQGRAREELVRLLGTRKCPSCGGTRLKKAAEQVLVGGMDISKMTAMPVSDLQRLLSSMTVPPQVADVFSTIYREVGARLGFLVDVGLGYLTLGRSAHTLSGGESQRIRLAGQLGSGLSGVMYVLDEPSIGLHQCDNEKLLSTLLRLRDLGNSVIVVEHDEDTIRSSDMVVDMGPGAGENGGHIVAVGTPDEIAANPDSPTGAYLSGRTVVPTPSKRRCASEGRMLSILGCSGNNLCSVDLSIPVGTLVCVTGVSGSGKSSLVNDTLCRAALASKGLVTDTPLPFSSINGMEFFDKVVQVDQTPIGRTPRSNPATYTGVMTPIRELFSKVQLSRERGYDPGRFSFNVKGGRCETCQGDGSLVVEMHFLPDMRVVCETCRGLRFNRETLEVRYGGMNIAEVLELTVDEAAKRFAAVPAVASKLKVMADVGLGYVRLGQPATTLSGGEAQRTKLSLELARRDSGKTLYVLDEPTTGLHFSDVGMLVGVLHKLVDRGNTVIVIEHNLDVIKNADHLVDLGPGGGAGGGSIVFSGTPEQMAKTKKGQTARFVREILAKQKTVGKNN